MSTEQRSYLSSAIARCVGMKHSNIKKCTLSSIPKASGMDICPSIIPAISRCWNKGLTSEWLKGGSTATSWHISWSQPAVKFLSSLWWMKVKPLWWQIIARSTLNEAPQTQWLGILANSHPYLNRKASNKNPAPEWEEQSAKSDEHFALSMSIVRWSNGSELDLILSKLSI